MAWEVLGDAAGAGVPQAGFDASSLDLHPWAGKASAGSWEGRNSGELLGGFLSRWKAAQEGSREHDTG